MNNCPTCMFFIYFLHFVQYWIKAARADFFTLFPTMRKHSVFALKTTGFLRRALCWLSSFIFPVCWKFCHDRVLNFISIFALQHQMILWFFFSSVSMMWRTPTEFLKLNQVCLVRMYIIYIYIAKILLSIFACMYMKNLGL